MEQKEQNVPAILQGRILALRTELSYLELAYQRIAELESAVGTAVGQTAETEEVNRVGTAQEKQEVVYDGRRKD